VTRYVLRPWLCYSSELRVITSPPPRKRCEVLPSACLYVCLSTRISQRPHVETSRKFLYTLPVAVARSTSDDNAICYVLPVLWMTSCCYIMGQLQIQAWSLRYSELFSVTRQVAPLNCALWAKSAIADRLVDDCNQ